MNSPQGAIFNRSPAAHAGRLVFDVSSMQIGNLEVVEFLDASGVFPEPAQVAFPQRYVE